jgi:hypothetical protein
MAAALACRALQIRRPCLPAAAAMPGRGSRSTTGLMITNSLKQQAWYRFSDYDDEFVVVIDSHAKLAVFLPPGKQLPGCWPCDR